MSVGTSVILDSDIGDDVDDALALALALRSPGIELLGVLTNSGHVRRRARLARALARLDAREVQAFQGIGGRGVRAFGDGGLPGDDARPVPRLAAAIRRLRARLAVPPGVTAGSREEPVVTIVCTGGLANADRLLRALTDHERARLRLVVMGGALERDYHGHRPACIEDNFGRDPEAARRVLAADVDLTLVPLDVTWNLTLDPGGLQAAVGSDGLVGGLGLLYRDWRRRYGWSHPVLHDPLALAAAIRPPLLTLQWIPLVVDEDGRTRVSSRGRATRVAVSADRPRFLMWIHERLGV